MIGSKTTALAGGSDAGMSRLRKQCMRGQRCGAASGNGACFLPLCSRLTKGEVTGIDSRCKWLCEGIEVGSVTKRGCPLFYPFRERCPRLFLNPWQHLLTE